MQPSGYKENMSWQPTVARAYRPDVFANPEAVNPNELNQHI